MTTEMVTEEFFVVGVESFVPAGTTLDPSVRPILAVHGSMLDGRFRVTDGTLKLTVIEPGGEKALVLKSLSADEVRKIIQPN